MNLQQYLRLKFSNYIRPLFMKNQCEICGSEENLELHHDYEFNLMLDDTLKELELEYKKTNDYTELELKNITEKFLGKHLFYKYKTLCWDCHHNKLHNLNSKVKISKKNMDNFIYNIDYILENYLNKWIIVNDIQQLIKELNLVNEKGNKIGLSTFVKILEESHYKVIKKRKTVNKIKNTYYFIRKV